MRRKAFILALLISLLIISPASARKKKNAIFGSVLLEGARPQRSYPAYVDYNGPCGLKRSPSLVNLWRNKVVGATIWLSSTTQPPVENLPEETKVVGYRCDFSPKLTVVRPGTVVKIYNNDPYVQWLILEEDGEKKKQIMQAQETPPLEIVVQKGKRYRITSGFYPWMEAWIRSESDIITTTLTASKGTFEFTNTPPGDYFIHAWHPALGETYAPITLAPDKALEIELVFQMPGKKIPVIQATSLERFFGLSDDRDDNPFKR